MHIALRALLLIIIVGVVAVAVWLFATDPVEAPLVEEKSNDMTLSLTSPAFRNDESIPARFTCDGANISPALRIAGLPAGAKSLALVMDDSDVPKQLKPDGIFDHWTLFNIDPATTEIAEGVLVGTVGVNSRGEKKYTGPCPPPQYQPTEHRYVFTLLALDTLLDLPPGATKQDVRAATAGHVLGTATLVGRYDRTKTQ